MRQLLGERRTKAGALLAALAMLAAIVLMALPSRGATDTTTQAFWTGNFGPRMTVSGTVPGHGTITGSGGLLEINLEGKTTYAYCIEVLMPLLKGSTEPMDASPWSAANVPNLPNIQRILNQHPADATVAKAASNPTAANQEAAAVQAAIWHFSDQFDLTRAVTTSGATDQTTAVKAMYDQIVADASANPVGEPKPTTLTVTPDTATAQAGQEAGPFTISTTASSVTLSVSGGTAEIRDCTTHAVETTAADGAKVCLFRATEGGPVTLNVTGQADVDAGRVFINKAHSSQEIILAGTKTVTVDAAVKASWSAVAGTTTTTTPSSTTTTTQPTTTTTAPGTTSTTVAPSTTTTLAVLAVQTPPEQAAVTPPAAPAAAPAANTSTLPFTGSSALTVAAIAFALLSIGTFVVGTTLPAAERRQRSRR